MYKRQAHLQSDAPDLPWLEDYCTFAALHDRYQAPFWQWPEDAPPPEPEKIDFHRFLQDTFYRQWMALKKYASRRCIRIMGDIPFYLSLIHISSRPGTGP